MSDKNRIRFSWYGIDPIDDDERDGFRILIEDDDGNAVGEVEVDCEQMHHIITGEATLYAEINSDD